MAQLSLSLLIHRLKVTTVPTVSARASLLAHLAHTQSMGGALATCAQQAPTALKPKAPSINVNQANTPSKDGPPVKLVQPATLVARMVYCLHAPSARFAIGLRSATSTPQGEDRAMLVPTATEPVKSPAKLVPTRSTRPQVSLLAQEPRLATTNLIKNRIISHLCAPKATIRTNKATAKPRKAA